MDKESIIELQKIDCNCNDCKYLHRDIEKYKSFDHLYIENGKVTNPSHRPLYGNCLKLNKPVSFIANTCQIETQECFEHRRMNVSKPKSTVYECEKPVKLHAMARTYTSLDLIRFARFSKENEELKPIDRLKAYNDAYPELTAKQKLENIRKFLGNKF
jgi:hypothetical protein